jgi:hypothetical protein
MSVEELEVTKGTSILFAQIQDQTAELSISIFECGTTREGKKSPPLEDELITNFRDA